MARLKQSEVNIRKLTTVGGKSLAVTIPTDVARILQLKPRQPVMVRREGNKIVIEQWPMQ